MRAWLMALVLLTGCAFHTDRPAVFDRDMFSVNPLVGAYGSYAEYLSHQYYVMGGGVPSDLSSEYGRCMDRAYLESLTADELRRLDAAARGDSPLTGAEKDAFDRAFVAHMPGPAMEAKIQSLCPETVEQVKAALDAAG
jgi:hypothetical protein